MLQNDNKPLRTLMGKINGPKLTYSIEGQSNLYAAKTNYANLNGEPGLRSRSSQVHKVVKEKLVWNISLDSCLFLEGA